MIYAKVRTRVSSNFVLKFLSHAALKNNILPIFISIVIVLYNNSCGVGGPLLIHPDKIISVMSREQVSSNKGLSHVYGHMWVSQSARERDFIVKTRESHLRLDKNTATVRMHVLNVVLNVEGFIIYLNQGNHGVQWIYSE